MARVNFNILRGLAASIILFSIFNVVWLHFQIHDNQIRPNDTLLDKTFGAKTNVIKSGNDSLQIKQHDRADGKNVKRPKETNDRKNVSKTLTQHKNESSHHKKKMKDKPSINNGGIKNKIDDSQTKKQSPVHEVKELKVKSNIRVKKSNKKAQVDDKLSFKSDKNEKKNQLSETESSSLSCEKYGGLSDEIIAEMSYWSYVPSDSSQRSPFYDPDKYLTFEPDQAGWNNKRIVFETVLALARATGRTLVMPPKDRNNFRITDPINSNILNEKISGLRVISMDEFLQRKAITGQLKHKTDGTVLKPPKDRVHWDGKRHKHLWEYLRNIGFIQKGWSPNDCIAVIPSGPGKENIDEIKKMWSDIQEEKVGPLPDPEIDYEGKPTPVDAPPVHRLRELVALRDQLCIYDETLQNADLIHFPVIINDNDDDVGPSYHERLFQHFYAFIFFQDWKHDLLVKRFIRDYVHYKDKFLCAAGQIVEAIRKHAKSNNKNNVNGEFDTMHIRRDDFEDYFPDSQMEPAVLLNSTKGWLEEKGTIYIATNEENLTYYDLFKEQFNTFFLEDFKEILGDVDEEDYGIIEQLVVTKGRNFIGTWFSTLSGYANRMRGYYVSKHKLEGYQEGTLRSYYFVPKNRALAMTSYRPVKEPFFMREFPIAWRDIDKGVEEVIGESETG